MNLRINGFLPSVIQMLVLQTAVNLFLAAGAVPRRSAYAPYLAHDKAGIVRAFAALVREHRGDGGGNDGDKLALVLFFRLGFSLYGGLHSRCSSRGRLLLLQAFHHDLHQLDAANEDDEAREDDQNTDDHDLQSV